MRELGIAGIQPRSSKRTTIADPEADDREDLIGRNFEAPVATTKLVGDITYLRTAEGWLYLATVICLTTRMVVGWQIADNMRTGLIKEALKMAHDAGYVAGNAIFHSDRGAQYTSAEFAKLAKQLDVRLSVGRTGSCHDNAVAESFFAFLKNEMYYLRKFATKSEARNALFEYIELFYNRRRRHSTLGYRTPIEAMRHHLNLPVTKTHQLAA
jgi:transposase InsO family protein